MPDRRSDRRGLPAEEVLRCALLKQYRQLSSQELALHLEDSASFRAFARLPWSCCPQKSVLQKTISGVSRHQANQVSRCDRLEKLWILAKNFGNIFDGADISHYCHQATSAQRTAIGDQFHGSSWSSQFMW